MVFYILPIFKDRVYFVEVILKDFKCRLKDWSYTPDPNEITKTNIRNPFLMRQS